MKQLNKFLLTLLLSGAGTAGALAEYHCDFNTPITTSNPSFIVADGWGHKLDSSYTNDESYNTEMYVYLANGGVDGTGALRANVQDDGAVTTVYDYLITPPVKGTVTVMAKDLRQDWDGDDCYVEVWAYNKDTQTVGSKLKTIVEEDIPKTEYTLLTLADNLSSYQCLAIRLQHVAIDDFKATSIEGDDEGGDTPEVDYKYTVDFNTAIPVSSSNFKVASNWKHKVGANTSDYGGPYYMKYEYQATSGIDNSGCLWAENQEAGNYSKSTVYDYLVTPLIKGKAVVSYQTTSMSSSYPGKIEVYKYDDETNQVGEKIKEISNASVMNEWVEFDLTDEPLADFERLALRIQRVRLDNFKAEEVQLVEEKSFAVTYVDPNPSTGTIYWNQAADGTVPIKFKVKVTNNGEVNLTQGMDKYSISLYSPKGVKIGDSVAIPFDLAKGAESEEFEAEFIVPSAQLGDIFSGLPKFTIQDDFNGEGVVIQQSSYNKYESKYIFCLASDYDSTSYSLSANQGYGLSTEAVTKEYQIRNKGIAPLEVVSITLPEGFTTTLTETSFTLAGGESKTLPITLSETGQHSGNLVIVYKSALAQENTTYELGFSGNMVAADTWYYDFNGKPGTFNAPYGSLAESNIECEYKTYNAEYSDNYIYCRYSSNPRFYTPLLEAQAGDTFSFDIKNHSNASTHNFKVYVTTDRYELGEPVLEVAAADLPSTFETKTITIPEAGNYYIVFNLEGAQLDNLVGLKKANVGHDVHFGTFTLSSEIFASEKLEPSIYVYALSDLLEDEYTIDFILNNVVAATAESIDMDYNAKTSKIFKVSFTPEVAETVTYEGFWRITFEDGTVFESPKKEVKISYESKFAFGKSVSANKWWPATSDTTPIIFDKTNQPGSSVVYKIANSGGAPLNVTSISVSENFAVTPTECVVDGLANQEVTISLVAETAGNYEGVITIEYEGMEEPYTLAMQGTMLDPTKWYVNFEDETVSSTGAWPEGSVVLSNVMLKDIGTYSKHNVLLHTTGYVRESNRMFISPLLRATAGETMVFDSRVATTSSADTPTVKIWAAPDRNSLLTKNDEGGYDNAILLLELTRDSEDEATKLEDNTFKTYTVTVPTAGDYYIGFEPSYFAQIDEISGLSVVPVEADMTLDSASIPTEGMQNKAQTGTIKVRNFLKTIEAGDYTVKAHVGDFVIEKEGNAEIAANHLLTATAVSIPVTFQSPKPGTFPVYFELIKGDFTLTTDPVEVTFAEEVASNSKQVGTPLSTQRDLPFAPYWKSSESVTLYSAENLGLNKGDKISSFSYKGYRSAWTKDDMPEIKVYYEWTDDQTQSQPSGAIADDVENMTLCFDGTVETTAVGDNTAHEDIFVVNFEEPLVYEAGKSLRIAIRCYAPTYQDAFYFEKAADIASGYYRHQDGVTLETITNSWSTGAAVLYLNLVAEPKTLSGTVTNGDDNEAVADATVTLISNDGDNVQYETTTDENGEFSINVIQSGREYNVEVAANGKEDFVNGVSVAEESLEQDFVLLDVIQISDDSDHSAAPAEAVAYLQKALNPGYNAIALPIALSQVETEAIFGEDAVIYEFNSVLSDPEETTVMFSEVFSKEMEAGVPYLVYIEGDEARPVVFKTKGTMADLKTETSLDTDFLATTKRTPVAEKMFVLSDENFVSASKARTVTELPAYSGYIKSETATSLNFTTDENYQTLIKDAEVVNEGEDVIYDLNGLRVKNPEKGIYIINGKAVRVK